MKKFSTEIKLQKILRKQIYDAIQGPVIETLIKQLSDSQSDIYWKSVMDGHSFRVQSRTMKHYYDLFHEVKETLGCDAPIDFYITGDSSVNAFSVASEKEGEPNIVNINSALIELMTDDELRFVVGHEIGHLLNKDTHFQRLLSFVFSDSAAVPVILQYKIRLNEQLSELVADRYGFMAAPSIATCVSAFFKMSSGLDVKKLDVEMDALIEENKERLEYFLKGEGVSTETHPVNPIRVQALNLLATCKTRKELDTEMDNLVSILLKIGTSQVDKYMPAFVASAGLIVASADKEVVKEEYDEILSTLSAFTMFPKQYLDQINEGDVSKTFEDSVSGILSAEPGMREALFNFVLKMVVSDQKFHEKEIQLIYSLGTTCFGYQEKEVAQMFAAMIQSTFDPDIENLC